MSFSYKNLKVSYETDCRSLSIKDHISLCSGCVRADKRKVTRIVKNQLPDLYQELALWAYNPFNYYRTKTHIILVHSAIEYFLRIE